MLRDGLSQGNYTLDLGRRRVQGPLGEIGLTELEARLLGYLAERRGQIVPGAELLREVWGYHPGVSSKAVQLLVSRLRKKLGDDPEHPQLIQTAAGGYRLPGPPDIATLVARTERCRGALRREGRFLLELDALQPEVEAALEQPLAAPDRARLLLARCEWSLERSLHSSAAPLWEVLEQDLPPHLAVACAIGASRQMAATGTPRAAYDALKPWLERCPSDIAGQHLCVRVELVLCNQARQLGWVVEGEAHAQRALELASRLGDAGLRGQAMGQLSFFRIAPSQAAEAEALLNDAIAILRAAGERVIAAIFEVNLGVALQIHGRPQEAIARFQVAAPALRQEARPLDAAMCEVNEGTAHLVAGAPERALDLALATLPVFFAATDHTGECYARLLQGRAELALGRDLDAVAALQRCAGLSARLGFRRVEGHALRYLAAIDQLRGDHAAAADGYRRALQLLPSDDLYGRLAIGRWAAVHALGLGEEASVDDRPLVWLDQRLLDRLRGEGSA